MGYWETIEKMWGKSTASAVHWVVNAFLWGAILVGIILVVCNVITVTLTQIREHDKTTSEALKIAFHGVIKYIIGIAIAIIAVPCLWELLVPFLISQGYDPSAAK